MSDKKITVIATGGTIAMSVDSKTGVAIPSLSGDDLINSLSPLSSVARIDMVNFCNKPGTHMLLEEVLEISKIIRNLFKSNQADGVVITHGTDTLEETAYALDLLLNEDNPVVVTGAMRNSSQPSFDGSVNLYDSILTAASDSGRAKGVMVVFNNEIHLARDVTKASATQLNAFRSPLLGPLGIIYGNKVQFIRAPICRESIPVDTISAQVEVVKFTLGTSNFLLEAIADSKIDGFVIEGAGVGHVSLSFAEGIRKLIELGKVGVLSTRCYEGLVLQGAYGFPGSEKSLYDMGIIMAPGLNGQKARIKLILALSHTRDIKKIRELFNIPITYS
jgi:L-asparaginase